MPAGSDRVVYTGAGLFVETTTERRVYVTFAYHAEENGGMVMQMTRGDGTDAPPWPLSAPQARLVEDFFFPKESGDGQPLIVRDPVNIDGTQRNRLRDRLRRGRSAESVAACWLGLVLTALCLHC